jgi:hypothetical protein
MYFLLTNSAWNLNEFSFEKMIFCLSFAKLEWSESKFSKVGSEGRALYYFSSCLCLNFNYVTIKKDFQNVFAYYGRPKHKIIKY